MFSVTEKMAAVCGRYSAHVHPISFHPLVEMGPLDISTNLPPGSKAIIKKLSLICLDLSPNSRFLVAADSGKNLYLFEFTPHTWDHVTSWIMEKRTAKIQFDNSGRHILITDKTGDVYISTIESPPNAEPGQVIISRPKVILKHDHRLLDVILSIDDQKILTCTSDEVVRVSGFPAVMEQLSFSFKLDHKDPVVNIDLVDRDNHLVSISSDGMLKFWKVWLNILDETEYEYIEDSSNPMGKSHKFLESWDIFSMLEKPRGPTNSVVRMSATTFEGRIYIAVLISRLKSLPVFELKPLDLTFRLFGQARLNNDYVDMNWKGKQLFVFCPAESTLNKYIISSHGGLMKEEFGLRFNISVRADIASYGIYNRPFFRAKKHVQTKTGTGKHRIPPVEFPKENQAAEALAAMELVEETPEERHARMVEFTKAMMVKVEEKKKQRQKSTRVVNLPLDVDATTSTAHAQFDDDMVDDDDDYVDGEDDSKLPHLDESVATQETESVQTDPNDDLTDYDDYDYEDMDDDLLDDDNDGDAELSSVPTTAEAPNATSDGKGTDDENQEPISQDLPVHMENFM